ncbi:hypothetical protein [Peribacillus simplex]|uniref:hypothetical protein n=1 Tax=Peribacillus simplex TaxID=1478 RepID=UPI003CFDC5DF
MIFGLVILVVLIGIGNLIYNLKLVKSISVKQSEYDSEISEKVKRHNILFNPVFLSYIIGFGLLFLFVFYLAMTYIR